MADLKVYLIQRCFHALRSAYEQSSTLRTFSFPPIACFRLLILANTILSPFEDNGSNLARSLMQGGDLTFTILSVIHNYYWL